MPKRPVSGTGQINAELPVELLDELKTFAKSRGEKVRDILAMALRRHLDNPPPPPKPLDVPPLPPVTSPASGGPEEGGMNRQFLAERLEDVELLTRAVIVGKHDDLAVPVGGKRRGGWCQVAGEQDARAVIAHLAKHPGFPNLRFEPSGKGIFNGHVCWGEPQPQRIKALRGKSSETSAQHDVDCGRYFGYSENVIREHLVKNYGEEVADTVLAEAPEPKKPAAKKGKK